jgi:hypothetical protein
MDPLSDVCCRLNWSMQQVHPWARFEGDCADKQHNFVVGQTYATRLMAHSCDETV